MDNRLTRVELLIGKDKLEILKNSCVLILGVGGVGGFAIEGLARSGVGKLIIIDKDDVSVSNLNRQIIANYNSIGNSKVDEMSKLINSYSNDCEVICIKDFYSEKINELLDTYKIDFVIDAIDTITSKIQIIKYCKSRSIDFITCTGMANRLDPTKIIVTDLSKTNYDPLSKVMRNIVKKERIRGKIPVVFSQEIPFKQSMKMDAKSEIRKDKFPPASMIFVPASAGLAASSYAIDKIIKKHEPL